jgi:hypothetical protein
MVGLHTSVSVHVDADRRPVRVVCGDHRRYYRAAVAFSLRAYRGRGGGAGVAGAASPSGCTSPVGRRSSCRPRSPGMTHPGSWPQVPARIDAEQGHRLGSEVAVYPCAPLQVLQPAGLPATLAPAT